MDKQKEIEKMAKEICNYVKSKDMTSVSVVAKSPYLEYLHNTGIAEWLVDKGYGDTKAAAKEAVADRTEEIFSWLYNNLVNANFVTGNAEISMVDLQNKAAEYGIDFFNNKGKLTVKEADDE